MTFTTSSISFHKGHIRIRLGVFASDGFRDCGVEAFAVGQIRSIMIDISTSFSI